MKIGELGSLDGIGNLGEPAEFLGKHYGVLEEAPWREVAHERTHERTIS